MRLTDIQKSQTGYILRQSKAVKAWTLVPCVFFLSVGISLPFFAERDVFTLVMAFLFMAFFAAVSVYLYCLSFGYRIVVDETGVHRYSFNRAKHTLLWRHIRSFGVDVIPVYYRYGTTNRLAFYASTETKPVNIENQVFIKLTKTDEQALRESGIIVFCRRQMAEADRKFR